MNQSLVLDGLLRTARNFCVFDEKITIKKRKRFSENLDRDPPTRRHRCPNQKY